MALYYRGPTYDDGSPAGPYPWGSGQGSPLLEWQLDNNFYYLFSLIQSLTEGQTAGISYFVINGNLLYVHLTDHTVLGPYVLPMWSPIPVGEWQPLTSYVSNNILWYNGATYLVNIAHTSQSTFNPNYEIGGNPVYSPPIIECPGSSLPLGGEPGQSLTVVDAGGSVLPTMIWAYTFPAGGTAGDFLKLVTPGTSITAAVTEWTALDLSSLLAITSPLEPGDVATWTGSDWTNQPAGTTLTPGSTPTSSGTANTLFYDDGTLLQEATVGSGLELSGGVLAQVPFILTPTAPLSQTSGTFFNSPDFAQIPLAVYTVTPTGNLTLETGNVWAGAQLVLVITTSGVVSYNITFTSNFKSQGVLVTGVTSGAVFTISFTCDGISWNETSRTIALS